MFKLLNPRSIADPSGAYTHGVEIPPNSRVLFVSGQTALRKDGTIPQAMEEQTEVVWQNIAAVLASAGMGIADVCKMNSYLTKLENFSKYRVGREKYLGNHRPASTSVVIASLAKPEYLLEVEVVAAKAVPAKRAAAPRAKAPARKTGRRSRR